VIELDFIDRFAMTPLGSMAVAVAVVLVLGLLWLVWEAYRAPVLTSEPEDRGAPSFEVDLDMDWEWRR
jgi:hypothetical protein